jgi:septum formation protein
MVFNKEFILASSSLSRYKILKNNKLIFFQKKPLCNEDLLKKKLIKKKATPKKISLELSRLKSKSISKIEKNKLVVGSDTVISFEKKILSKAKNIESAKKIITSLSNKKHFIFSSVSVFYNNKEVWHTTQKSEVKIRKLNTNEIEYYLLKTGKKILSSVGCYQIESMGPNIIKEIKGDFFNVMGFPLFPFLSFLKNCNIK